MLVKINQVQFRSGPAAAAVGAGSSLFFFLVETYIYYICIGSHQPIPGPRTLTRPDQASPAGQSASAAADIGAGFNRSWLKDLNGNQLKARAGRGHRMDKIFQVL